MNIENLEEIRIFIIDNVMRNDNAIYNGYARNCMVDASYSVDLVDIIASLYNLLHQEITGEKYDYMFHWANKIGGEVNENLFDRIIGGEDICQNGER